MHFRPEGERTAGEPGNSQLAGQSGFPGEGAGVQGERMRTWAPGGEARPLEGNYSHAPAHLAPAGGATWKDRLLNRGQVRKLTQGIFASARKNNSNKMKWFSWEEDNW